MIEQSRVIAVILATLLYLNVLDQKINLAFMLKLVRINKLVLDIKNF